MRDHESTDNERFVQTSLKKQKKTVEKAVLNRHLHIFIPFPLKKATFTHGKQCVKVVFYALFWCLNLEHFSTFDIDRDAGQPPC